jgi:hypothetical protein
MNEYKVKNKFTGIVMLVQAETKYHAINKAMSLSSYVYGHDTFKDFKIIK